MSSIQSLAHQLAAQREAAPPQERVLISLRIQAETHALLAGLSKATGLPLAALASSILSPGVEEFRTQYLSQLSGEDLANAQRTIATYGEENSAEVSTPAGGDGQAEGSDYSGKSAGQCGCGRQGRRAK
ncbi:MAG: hypothetical protein ACYCXG_11190 [Acidiferrobacter sp.]